MVAAYLAGGWALLDSGHMFWGGASVLAAIILPALLEFLTRYQQQYAMRAKAKVEAENRQLLEIADRESASGMAE